MPKTIQVNSENNNVKNNYSVNNINNNKATTVGGYRNDRKPKAGIYDRYNVVTEQFELFTPKVIEMEKSEVTIKIENSIKYLENIKNSLEEEKQKLINKRQSFDAMARNGKYSGLFYEGNSKGVKNCLNPDEALKSNAFFVKYLKDNGYKTDRDKMSSDEYGKLQKEFVQYINTVYTDKYNEYFSQYVGMTYADYKSKIASLNSDITTIKASKYELVQQAKEQPYLELLNTEELKNYVANNYNNKNSKLYFLNGISNGTITLADNSMRFNYLTEQDRMIYSYLYDTQSAFAAGEFLKAIEDKLNKAEGLANAEKFLDKIRDGDGNIDPTVISGLLSSGHGVSNGLTSFFDGFAGVISDEGMMTTTQYEQMYILSELTNSSGNYINKIATSISESRGEEAANEFMRNIYVNNSINLEYAKKVLSDKQYTNLIKKMEVDDKSILDNCYELGTSAGNMLPSVVVSIGVTALLPGVGITVAGELMTVGSLTGSTLMGISAAGNARNQALIQGNSKYSSTMYGLLSGISETTLGLLLGNIPGLNANASFSVKGILKEGFEEMVQEYFDAGLRTAILDETIDISELSKDALKSFIYGSIMSGVMNGGQLSLTIIGDSIGAGRVKISSVQELTSFVDNYCKDMDIDISRIESTVSKTQNTGVSSIESQIITANMYTDRGNLASIDVSDISLITDEVLSKIKNIDNVMFRMSDGENINISQLLSRRNSAKVVSDNVTNNARNNIENSNTHVEQNVSNARDSIHDIESQIATANMYTDRGYFASIDVNDISLITDEVLSKIKNVDNVNFRLPDGSNISYSELTTMRNSIIGSSSKSNESLQFYDKEETARYFGDAKQIAYLELQKKFDVNDIKSLPKDLWGIFYKLDANGEILYVDKNRKFSTSSDGYPVPSTQDSINDTAIFSAIEKYLSPEIVSEINGLRFDPNNNIERLKNIETIKSVVEGYTHANGPAIAAVLRGNEVKFRGAKYDGNNSGKLESLINKNDAANGRSDISDFRIRDHVAVMDYAISSSPATTKEFTVYRGVDQLFDGNMQIDPKLLEIGQVISDKAFLSTTMIPNSNITDSRNILIKIKVPEGSKGLYVESLNGVQNYGQQEFLLPRDSKLRLTNYAYEDSTTGKTILEMELLPNDTGIDTVDLPYIIKEKMGILSREDFTQNGNSTGRLSTVELSEPTVDLSKDVTTILQSTDEINFDNFSSLKKLNFDLIKTENQFATYYDCLKSRYGQRYLVNENTQVDFANMLSDFNDIGYLKVLDEAMFDMDSSNAYASNLTRQEHGIDHAERVLTFASYIGLKSNLSAREMAILIESSKWHDCGRADVRTDSAHAIKSVDKINSLIGEGYSLEDINMMKAAIELHEINETKCNYDEVFNSICNKYSIGEQNAKSLKSISDILKDADALDRTRFANGNLDPIRLRNTISANLIKASCQLQEARGFVDVESMKNQNMVSILKQKGWSDYDISFNYKYFPEEIIKAIK